MRVLHPHGSHDTLGAKQVALLQQLFSRCQLRRIFPVDRKLLQTLQGTGISPIQSEHPAVGSVGCFRLAGHALTRRIIEVCIDRLALVTNHRGLDFGITWPITRGLFERGDALFSFTGCHEIKPAPKIGVGAPTQEHCHEHKNPALFQTIIQSDLHRGEP